MLKFELLKIYRDKTTYIFFLFITLSLILPFTLAKSQSNDLFFYESNYDMALGAIESMKNDPNAEEAIKDVQETADYMKEIIDGIKENDNKKIVNYELKLEKKNLNDMEAGTLVSIPLVDQKSLVATLQNIKDNNMEKLSSSLRKLGSVNYFSILLSNFSFVLIILILIAIHISFLVNSDSRGKNLNIYSASPTSKLKIYVTKFIAYSITIISNLVVSFTFIFLFLAIKNGTGNSEYPIARIINNSEVTIMTTKQFLLKNLLFYVLLVVCFLLWGMLISLVSKNLIIGLTLLVIPLIVSQPSILNTYVNVQLLPFILLSYFDIANIIVGGSGFVPLPNEALTYKNGFLLLTIVIFVIIAISIVIIKTEVFNKFTNYRAKK